MLSIVVFSSLIPVQVHAMDSFICYGIYAFLVVPIRRSFLCRDNLLSPFSQNVD